IRSAVAGGATIGRRLPRPLATARTYIEEHLDEDFDLVTLSNMIGFERCRLCRLFQKAVGLPPRRFRSHLRVARARKLLAAGVEGIEGAHAVGFCDQSHPNRWFKELTGTTPGAHANRWPSLEGPRPATGA